LRFSPWESAHAFGFSESDWKKALAFCDRAHLTLAVGLRRRDQLPEWVRDRIDHNLARNAQCWSKTKAIYEQVASAFQAEGLDFVVLKGFSHCPYFVSEPGYRPQGDLDLLLPREQAFKARDIALQLGYEPLGGYDRFPIDHLPTMIRKTGWEWRGDYFDPDSPTPLELHFRLWDERTEGFGPKGLERFWERRETRELDGLCFAALHPADAVAYAALHLLRHLLRGDLGPYHLYELAWLLEHRVDDTGLWSAWRELHDDSLRRLEGICFDLARRWFDCRMPAVVADEISRLPPEVARWLEMHSTSPLAGMFRPNKDELWLHWSLLESRPERFRMLRRRLLPGPPPGPIDAVNVPEEQLTWRIRLRRRWRYAAYAASRVMHHARALPTTAWSALRWFAPGAGFGAQYWRFYLAAGFFDFGLFIYFLLYNLYLLQLGFRENFLGLVSSAMTAGGVAGCIPSAIAIRRFGIRTTLLFGFVLIAILSAFRASVTFAPALIGLAFAGGLVASVWAVAISPAIAQLTNERNRPLGFSIIFSSGIAIGIFGGLAGGRLPGLLSRLHFASSSLQAYRESLLLACAMVVLALWPLSRTGLGVAAPDDRRRYRPSPRIIRFLIAMAIWNLGTGAFNPFANAFFARMRLPVEQIGVLFSSAQMAQAGAILLAPMALRRLGLTRGISAMQLATAAALIGLTGARGAAWAGVAYAAYMTSQYMSEPGMYTYLMGSAPAGDRSAASALNFLVTFSAQAIAAAAAGAFVTRFGYPAVLLSAALICAAAALLFRLLLGDPKPDPAAAR